MPNDMSTTVMWSKSKPDVEFQYGGRLGEFNGMPSQSHVSHCRVVPLGEFTVTIPEPHATLQGAVTWRNQCHDRATYKNSIRHIENRFSPYFFCFKCSLGYDEGRLLYHLRYTCINGRILYRFRNNARYIENAKFSIFHTCTIPVPLRIFALNLKKTCSNKLTGSQLSLPHGIKNNN